MKVGRHKLPVAVRRSVMVSVRLTRAEARDLDSKRSLVTTEKGKTKLNATRADALRWLVARDLWART